MLSAVLEEKAPAESGTNGKESSIGIKRDSNCTLKAIINAMYNIIIKNIYTVWSNVAGSQFIRRNKY